MFKRLHAFFNPEEFRGWGKKRSYFEGWYFKIISPDESSALSVIPGIAMDKEGNRQAFIQVLDGKKQTSAYHKFPFEEFHAVPKTFRVSIGNNNFSADHVSLDLPDLKGSLRFSGLVPWPKPFYSPGIMGPYSFAPFMECYHAIVSMDHTIEGELMYDGRKIDFTAGRGYTEKDWGHSFPSAYFWLQTNHFEQPGTSLKCSVARIPWMTSEFAGFIAGLWWNNKLYRFATYNGTRLKRSFADKEKVEIVMENTRYRLSVFAHRHLSTELAAPILGLMDGRIEESMTSMVEVELYDRRSKMILFSEKGRNTALEVAGKIDKIFV